MSQDRTIPNPISEATSDTVRVGVLSFHESKETKAILNSIAALGHDPIWLSEENTRLWIADGDLKFEPDVDIIVNRLLTTKMAQPLDDLGVAASYAAVRPILNHPYSVIRAMHKYVASALLSAANVSVPNAFWGFHRHSTDESPSDGSRRAVHKPVIGTNGVGMSIVYPGNSNPSRIDDRRAFIQEYLAPDAERLFDVRVYVVDGEIIGAMKRYARADEWRTNVALGGNVEDVTGELPTEAEDLALRATDILDLDYAGVDLLRSGGSWYVLEVNATAGFKGFYEATGICPAAFIARLAIERVGGEIPEQQFFELTRILDDSNPMLSRHPTEHKSRQPSRRRVHQLGNSRDLTRQVYYRRGNTITQSKPHRSGIVDTL